MKTKLNQLLHNWPRGAVYTTKYLGTLGITKGDIAQYKNRWLYSLGHGAYARIGDSPDWTGAVYALQSQLKLPIHVGGNTGLHMSGYGHFIPLTQMQVQLFGSSKTKLPKWFLAYNWNVEVRLFTRDLFIQHNLGLTTIDIGNFRIQGSSPERGILEVTSLIPKNQDFQEARLLLENLTTLRPHLLQNLLENCRSIRAKRLFLYLARQVNLAWFSELKEQQIDLGTGKRQIVKGGILDNRYQITVPKEFEES